VDERTRQGIIAKLERAKEHLERLHGEVDTFLDGKPHSYWAKPDFYAGRYALHVTINQEPPAPLSVTCGDFVHCLRSALDHLICGAVPKITKRTSFPIYRDGDDFLCGVELPAKRKQWGPLTGLDPDGEMFALVKTLQPYAGPHGYEAHFLHVLAELSNADKHRAILASAAANRMIDTAALWVRGKDIICSDAEYALGTPLINGAKVAWGTLTVVGAEPEMEMEGDLPVDIAFGPVLVRLEGLEEVRKGVGDAIAYGLKVLGLPFP
jgi:hypothetical protein